jgi:hypothetical protein
VRPRTRRDRAILAALGVASLVAAVAVIPHDAGRASSVPAPAQLAAGAPSSAPASVWTAPKRNPFAGDPASIASPSQANAVLAPTNSPLAVVTPPPIGAEAAERVTAIVSGAHPAAIVEVNAHARVVTPGDRIAGRTIVAIDAGGVLFDDGSALELAPPGRGGHVAR